MNRRSWMKIVGLSATATLIGGAAVLAPSNSSATEPTTSPAPSTQPALTDPRPGFGPIAYYDQSCANCHGPGGSFYGPDLGKNLTDSQLRKVVRDMAEGPGNAPLPPDQIDAETAYHRALILKTPFISVTTIEGAKWTGEVMPDAKVTLTVGKQTIVAKTDGSTWTADLPPGSTADTTIIAEQDGKTTTLKPSQAMYSHTAALAAPADRAR